MKLKALKGINSILTAAVLIFAISLSMMALYVIVSDRQVFLQAEDVRADLYEYKPVVDESGHVDFSELKEINNDIVAWLTVDNTGIDYPVVQGPNNLTYMDTDYFGEYSLAGSIFLDSRNKDDLSDHYCVIYGHHMSEHLMFGDLDLFKDPEFFENNKDASILIPDGGSDYIILSYAEIPDSVQEVFDPSTWGDDLTGLEIPIQLYSTNIRDEAMELLISEPENVRVVALVTCASSYTGTRIVVFMITRIVPDDLPTFTPAPPTTVTPTPTEEPTPTPTETLTPTPTETPTPTPTETPTPTPTSTPTPPPTTTVEPTPTPPPTGDGATVYIMLAIMAFIVALLGAYVYIKFRRNNI